MTVRHLLNQTSGLPLLLSWGLLADLDQRPDATERQARALSTLKLSRPVGSAFEYSNLNYNLLGLVIEAASAEPYPAYIQDHIFGPLEMRHSYTSKAPAKRDGMAVGHQSWFGVPRPVPDLPMPRGALPSGQLISSAEDMGRYLIAHLNGGRCGDVQILSPEGIAELHRPAVDAGMWGFPAGQYGMGWYVEQKGGAQVVWHSGLVPDFYAYVAMLPALERGVVLLCNADHLTMQLTLTEVGKGVTTLLAGDPPPPIKLGGVPGCCAACCSSAAPGRGRRLHAVAGPRLASTRSAALAGDAWGGISCSADPEHVGRPKPDPFWQNAWLSETLPARRFVDRPGQRQLRRGLDLLAHRAHPADLERDFISRTRRWAARPGVTRSRHPKPNGGYPTMSTKVQPYRVIDLPASRREVGNFIDLWKHPMYGLLEVDVTVARGFIEEYKARTGETLSFTGYMVYCLARAVDEHKAVQAYRKGRNQLVIFDDVNVGIMVERKVGEKRELAGHVIRAASRKTYLEIHQEIRSAQSGPAHPEGEIPSWVRLLTALPWPISAWFNALVRAAMRRDPTIFASLIGTVGVTAVGMFGKGIAGWGIVPTPFSLALIVGSTTRKPAVVADRIEPRGPT
jgi:CubicO group peptidase (beta-lactamase class C family)/chloramphenicol O-acetyltransferase